MSAISSTAAADLATWTAGQKQLSGSSGPAASARDISDHLASSAQPTGKAKDVGQQFEAMYLRQMLDEFMPKDSEALFGKGTSGTMWRSMLVDGLATALSKSGTIGLAQLISKGEPKISGGKS